MRPKFEKSLAAQQKTLCDVVELDKGFNYSKMYLKFAQMVENYHFVARMI